MRRLAAACAAAAALALHGRDGSVLGATTAKTSTHSSDSSGSAAQDVTFASSETMSGILPWVDVDTPDDRQMYVSSRGDRWQLVMSDEFSDPYRNFTAGQDHLWTSLEKPDGVNGALDIYAHDMTFIHCEPNTTSTADNTNGNCYMVIKVQDEVNTINVFNQYLRPPAYQNKTLFYRSGMLQTWNKFCFQGGMLEVRAQLPGAIRDRSQNPDMNLAANMRTSATSFYPTWPGIWMMGNLGRAIFSGSTSRMWPFSYNECRPEAFNPSNQRISACNSNPGHGLNPNQGRGAPEIDLLEGGGGGISSSIQIGPGLKTDFRRIEYDKAIDGKYCSYDHRCTKLGANHPNVPTSVYQARKHQTWYKGLRYASNNVCNVDQSEVQDFDAVNTSLTVGITENRCTIDTCPSSNDTQSDLGYIDGIAKRGRWGINSRGTCFAVMNAYMGSYLCDPDNTNPLCPEPRNATTPKTNVMAPFNYQMDAISANWGIHVGAYTGFLIYQVEWTTGDYGYLRWMLNGTTIYEIPAQSIVNGPQDAARSNPRLTFPEEPMYIIFNVALSDQWGAKPPNPGKPCRGNSTTVKAEDKLVCDGFPMYMKIDYVRLYQDVSAGSNMTVGCDPSTHPTRRWILDHIEEYTDDANPHIEVHGGAMCRVDNDCTVVRNRTYPTASGACQLDHCVCSSETFTGPRCTSFIVSYQEEESVARSYGPPVVLAASFGAVAFIVICAVVVIYSRRRRAQETEKHLQEQRMRAKMELANYRFDKSAWSEDGESVCHEPSTPLYEYKRMEG